MVIKDGLLEDPLNKSMIFPDFPIQMLMDRGFPPRRFLIRLPNRRSGGAGIEPPGDCAARGLLAIGWFMLDFMI